MKLKKEKLTRIVNKFKKARVLVIGDLILDQYTFGKVERISPEAPVPIVWASREKYVGGGAANVAFNISELGAKANLCGVLGNDYYGKVFLDVIRSKKNLSPLIIKDKERPTTLKTRIIAQHQQVLRVDWESCEFLSEKTNKAIFNLVKKHLDTFDAIIIEDYGKGTINPSLLEKLVDLCRENKKIITVDPKEDHFDYYYNVTALTPNLKEAEYAAGMKIRSRKEISLLGELLIDKFNPQALLITLGEDGMRLFVDKKKSYHIPTTALEVFDVTGAGDTVIAVFTLALVSGADFLEAAVLANFAAGTVVRKLGAAVAEKEELSAEINSMLEKLNIEVFS